MSTSTRTELLTDGHSGLRTFVVDSRQDRPNLPATGCPFCPGGLEAPGDYDTRWFPNRWPAMPDLPSLGHAGRAGLAELLVDVLSRFDRLFAAETPYMLWIHQRPFDGRYWPGARLHVEIVTPWRAAGVLRYVAAGELGSGVYFNPVDPEAAAQALRDAIHDVGSTESPGTW